MDFQATELIYLHLHRMFPHQTASSASVDDPMANECHRKGTTHHKCVFDLYKTCKGKAIAASVQLSWAAGLPNRMQRVLNVTGVCKS